MRVFFRADASIQMGSGHVMRCLTLADELRVQGAVIKFITRAHLGNIADAISKRGYELSLLPVAADTYKMRPDDVAHVSWLGVSWQQDAEESMLAIGDSVPDWLIVDHYAIDERWHNKLREKVGKIMVIDDLADRCLDCDILLDQTYGRQVEDYLKVVPPVCQMLLGTRYALLRPEFSQLRPMAVTKRKLFNGIKRILIAMGGMDPENVTATVLEGLTRVDWKEKPVIDVVLGGNAPYLEYVVKMVKKSNLEIFVSTDVSDMADRMLAADMAIGAGGATSWERCCMGLPSLAVVISENQVEIVKQLQNQGSIISLGLGEELTSEKVKESINMTLLFTDTWVRMSRKGIDVVDGKGVSRVVDVMYA